MRKISLTILIALLLGLTSLYPFQNSDENTKEPEILSYVINPNKQYLKFYWKNKKGENYVGFNKLKAELENHNKELIFAMNGRMFEKDLSPQGLYIENGKSLSEIDLTKKGYGNFYLQPNGIFYLTNNNKAVVCSTIDFKPKKTIKYATQSGPMLLIDGLIHPKFNKGSSNLHISEN